MNIQASVCNIILLYMLMNTHLHCASARETKISFEKQLETYLVGNWENAFGSIGGMQWVSKFAAKSGTNIGGGTQFGL